MDIPFDIRFLRLRRSHPPASPPLQFSALACALALVLTTGPTLAQQTSAPDDDDEETLVTLDTVVVKGQALRLGDNAFSTTRIGNDAIVQDRVSDIDSLFRQVPGMTVRTIGYGAVASSTVIRGFGGGGHGGDLGVVIDGIPLNEANSHADGYVDVQVLVPLEIANLTVYRGPVSALYGNFNRGGLVAFETRKTGDYAELDASVGEYGTVDLQTAIGSPIGERQQINFASQLYYTDSFREQSKTERRTAAGRYNIDLTDRVDLALSARLHKSDADGAARITRAQFEVDPYGIDPRTQNDAAFKDFRSLRADLNTSLSPDLRLLTFAYNTDQQFTRYFTRPVSATDFLQREETYDRDVYGVGANLNGQSRIADRPFNYVVGVEAFDETTEFQFFDGLDNRRRVNPAQDDRESQIRSVSAFGETNFSLHRLLDVSLGARYDRFTGQCRLLGPETGDNPCQDLDAIDNLSPKFGLKSQLSPWLQLRGSYSEGFAIPGGFTKYAPGAQSLEPVDIRQTELGVLLNPLDNVELDIVGYRIDSSEEIRTVSPGVFENFGATLRTGVEAAVRWQLAPSFELSGVYGHADSEIEQNNNPALIGKSVTNVPDHTATLNAVWGPTDALELDATWRYVGETWMDSANTRAAASYNVLDVGASYELDTRTPTRLYVNVDNVTDKVYATAASLSFGDELLTPGAPRTVRVGVQVGF